MDSKGNKKMVPLARELRRNMTREEKHLWYDFLQKKIGKYILDFYSASEKLAIEIDGSHHYETDKLAKDSKRTYYLNEYGISVIRFSNKEIWTNFSGVCQWIDIVIRNKTKVINNSPLDRF